MKAIEIYNHLKEKGTWVNWNRTCDEFLFGDPEAEVKSVAIGWMATIPNLKKALELDCNLFITHEPLYVAQPNEFGVYTSHGHMLELDDPWVQKGKWMEENNFVVFRCHDVWDDFPEIGIHGAWATWLGLNNMIYSEKFYEVHDLGEIKLEKLVSNIAKRLKNLNQNVVHYIGNPDQIVHKIAIGTGAITNYRQMHRMGADVLLVTDDGTRLWESGQWSEDSGIPLIIVNHATAEEPGVRMLAAYLKEQFPDISIYPIKRGCLYNSMVI
ncbi:MAG: hypothetical protein GF364_01065 [Candidatus Lokiarchaeota archaeon]|nr:hypothetical protein [Candidatus Lokiarchaeota archaeon]